LKYVIEALLLTQCEKIQSNEEDLVTFKSIKTDLVVLKFLLGMCGALVGGLQTTFLRAFTISYQLEHVTFLHQVYTLAYMVSSIFFATF
jgi:hypothetical protein